MVMINTCSKTLTNGFVKSLAKPHNEKQQVVKTKHSMNCLGTTGIFFEDSIITGRGIDAPLLCPKIDRLLVTLMTSYGYY